MIYSVMAPKTESVMISAVAPVKTIIIPNTELITSAFAGVWKVG